MVIRSRSVLVVATIREGGPLVTTWRWTPNGGAVPVTYAWTIRSDSPPACSARKRCDPR